MSQEKKPTVRQTRIEDYTPDSQNANLHSEYGASMFEEGLSQVGIGRSIVVDKNGKIIAGNFTQEMTLERGFKDAIEIETTGDQLVVVRRTDLDLDDPDDQRARRLAYLDNRVGEVSLTWNPEQLKIDFEGGFDFNGLFNLEEIQGEIVKVEPQRTPKEKQPKIKAEKAELVEKWGVEEGGVWEMTSETTGLKHRIMCGDSSQDMEKLMGDEKAQLVMTSPPYGVGKAYESGGIEEWQRTMYSVFSQTKRFANLHAINLGDRKVNKENIFELHTFGLLNQMMLDMGFQMVNLKIWKKDAAWAGSHPFWRQTYKTVDDFEFIGVFATEKPKHVKRLSDTELNEWGYRGVWEIPSVRANKRHPAEFPVELPSRCIRLFTDQESLILDPFGGRGTTILAAEENYRRCYTMEKEVEYVAETLERLVHLRPERVT